MYTAAATEEYAFLKIEPESPPAGNRRNPSWGGGGYPSLGWGLGGGGYPSPDQGISSPWKGPRARDWGTESTLPPEGTWDQRVVYPPPLLREGTRVPLPPERTWDQGPVSRGTHSPTLVWTDKQTENITSRHTSCAGGNNSFRNTVKGVVWTTQVAISLLHQSVSHIIFTSSLSLHYNVSHLSVILTFCRHH